MTTVVAIVPVRGETTAPESVVAPCAAEIGAASTASSIADTTRAAHHERVTCRCSPRSGPITMASHPDIRSGCLARMVAAR